MGLVLKQPFRDVVINGQHQQVKVTQAPLDVLRDAIDKDEVVSLRAVMYGAMKMMHYPYHTTPYDLELFVFDHFRGLTDDVEHGRVKAFTMPDNSHIWEEHYLHTTDLLKTFDVASMPCPSEDYIYHSRYGTNKMNNDNLYPRDFRRAFLVAIGDAKPCLDATLDGKLIPYRVRSPKEWEEHFARVIKAREPARKQGQVWGWARTMWDALEKYDINPNPDKGKNNDDDNKPDNTP